MKTKDEGFTLLEVLVALALLGMAVIVMLQLLSANLRAVAASDDYVSGVAKAEAKMMEILEDDKLSAGTLDEDTADGYRIQVSIDEALQEKAESAGVKLLDITLTVRWKKGEKERSLTLRTMKVVNKEIQVTSNK
jgi:general secretion pathway protein I